MDLITNVIQRYDTSDCTSLKIQSEALLQDSIETACIAGALAKANMLAAPIFYELLPSAVSLLPERICQLSSSLLAAPLIYCREKLCSILPEFPITFSHGLKNPVNLSFVLCGSTIEEILFRGIIQTALLTEAPKAILRKIAPQYEWTVDHTAAKVVRVAVTSLLFALAHIVRLGNYPGMLATQFVAGIVFAVLREKQHSLTNLSAIHFITNMIIIYRNGGLPSVYYNAGSYRS
jgi:hypothetical protein